jgi:hypothetical protein
VKKERIVTIPQPVIYRQRGGCYRAVRLVLRQYAAGGPILKKAGYVLNVPDIGVVVNRMTVVKMEPIIKVVGINRRDRSQQENDVK